MYAHYNSRNIMANSSSGGTSANTEEDELDRMALEEIMKETKRGRERAQTMGPMGWIKCPLQPTNKRFFRSVIMATMANPRHSTKTKANDDFKKRRASSSNKASTLDPGECNLSQGLSSRTKSLGRNTSKDDPTLTRKTSKRNVYLSDDEKNEKQESTTETSSTNQLPDTISDERKQSRKHKLKHKSKHKHEKKRKS